MTRRWWAVLGLLVLLAFALRVGVLHGDAPAVPGLDRPSDAGAYRLLASNLVDGKGYIRPYDLALDQRVVPTAEYPPGFPVLLAGLDAFGIDGATGQRTVLCLVGALTVGLVGLIGRRVGGPAVGLVAAGVAAIHPSLWSTDTSPLAEPLAAFLGALLVLVALAAYDQPDRARWWLGIGALAGVGGLVRSELLLAGMLLTVALAAVRPPKGGARFRAAGLAGLAVIVVLAPWTIRNATTFHSFVPLSNNLGSVARGANCDGAYSGRFKGLWVTNVGGDTADPAGACFTGFDVTHGRNEAQSSAQLRADGLRYVATHKRQVPGVVAARLGRTVGLYRLSEQAAFGGLEGRVPRWDRLGTRLFQVLSLVAVAGIAVRSPRRGPRWVVALPLVGVAATVAMTYGNLRFRAVADPLVVVLAVVAVFDAVDRWRGRGAVEDRTVDRPTDPTVASTG